MDPLALLSNLHGDGPATLHRLRRNGCDSLSALLTADLADLVPILGWAPDRAERFVREADALARRLAAGPAGAHGAVKRLLQRSSVSAFRDQLMDEAHTIAGMSALPDGREGVLAFLDRRAPHFGEP